MLLLLWGLVRWEPLQWAVRQWEAPRGVLSPLLDLVLVSRYLIFVGPEAIWNVCVRCKYVVIT